MEQNPFQEAIQLYQKALEQEQVRDDRPYKIKMDRLTQLQALSQVWEEGKRDADLDYAIAAIMVSGRCKDC